MQTYTPENDPLLARAKGLVQTAREVGVGSYQPMLDQFPALEPALSKKRDAGQWDYFIAIAGIYIAAARLQTLELGGPRELALLREISADLEAWDAINARACFENCKVNFGQNFEQLTEGGHEAAYITSDAIGLWIASNMFGRGPEADDEWQFMRRIGFSVTQAFFGWWGLTSETPDPA